jgi:hypothetical protein
VTGVQTCALPIYTIWVALGWCVVILVVAFVIAMRLYHRRVARG